MTGTGTSGARPRIRHAFDQATAVQAGAVPGRYRADVDPRWSVGGRPNGGYLLALATRAALAEAGTGHTDPLAVTGAFAATAAFGPVQVDVEVLRHGRATSVLRVRVSSVDEAVLGEPCLEAVVTAGRLSEDEPLVPGPEPPTLPPEDTCPLLAPHSGPFQVPLLGVVHERFDPACLGFAAGAPSGIGELRAWVRFADGRAPDPLALICIGDALPPPSFDLPALQFGWVPTLQLSTFIRAVPVPGPLVVRTVARSVGAGAVDETCDVWDCTGRLVAVAHQLAAVRPV